MKNELMLINSEYATLSTAIIYLNQNIIINMIINEHNVKIQSLFKCGFNVYRI